MSIYNIGDIAHWGSAADTYGVSTPGDTDGAHFTVKLNQEFWVTDIHMDKIGAYYSGWVRHNGISFYLERVYQSRLVDKAAWEQSAPERRKHPNLYPAIREDFKRAIPLPSPTGQTYILTRTISSNTQEDHTVLGVSSRPALLRSVMTHDLLDREQEGEIGRNRLSDLNASAGSIYHFSWSAEWTDHQSAHYTIEAAPVLTEPVPGGGEERTDGKAD